MKKVVALLLVAILTFPLLTGCSKETAGADSNFPEKEINLVIPYGPGGANDRAARAIAAIAQEKGFISKPMIVTNISGAATKSGISTVAKAEPDGYTLLVHHNALITAGVLGQLPEDLQWQNSLRPIAQVLETPLTFAVLKESKWNTMKDLFDDIIANPDSIKFGFPGINAPQSFAFQNVINEMAAKGSEVKVHPVYFEGGNAVKTAHLGGTVDVVPGITMDTVPEAVGGVYRILSVVSKEKIEALPDVPTLAEAGYPMPEGFDGALRMVVWAPKETPDEVVNKLEEILKKVYETQEWKDFIKQNSAISVFRSASEVEKVFKADEEAALKVVPSLKEKK